MIPKLNIDFPLSRAIRSFSPWLSSKDYPCQCSETFFLNHARTGLRIALSALNLPKGSKVGMSMYNCLTVMNAVKIAGYEIVFIDITDDLTLDLEDLKKKSSLISVLIVTHFYGIPNSIESIKEVIKNVPIIEDCAHAYGSIYIDGSKVGSKGDFAVFSTGLGKFPSIGDGGLLFVNNCNYLPKVQEEVSLLPRFSFVDEVKMILKGFAKYVAYRPMIYQILLPLKRRKQHKGSFKEMYQHREAKMPKYVHYLYEKEVPKTNEMMCRQKVFSDRLTDQLENIAGTKIPKVLFGKRNGFLFPIIVEDKLEIAKDSFLSQFEMTSHFAKSTLWAKEFEYKDDCPNAEKIAKHIIVLACNNKINNK